ncbi:MULTISPECIES: FAD-dependent oxidoreductase [Acinetobacter]|uniref:FAD-dependent oxidoreductase n=1 Tax=Acinetobacter TaxID=469 RepID=UPI001F4B15C2|nr:FAD-dependent oxidoreductase [Acinetobacter higginsii]MCH7380400.1 FAD-dependent oxidoreductase [Acinetobacter higginsii]
MADGMSGKYLLSKAKNLSRVVTEEDSSAQVQGTYFIEGVGKVVAVEIDDNGKIISAIDEKGAKHSLSKLNQLSRVVTESDNNTEIQQAYFVETIGSVVAVEKDVDSKIIAATGLDGGKYQLSKNNKLSRAITEDDLTAAFDVVIYGSGMPLITAAKTAKENGLSVCLICPDKRVGGMMTAGVSVFDGAASTPSASYGGSVGFLGGNTRKVLNEINTYYGAGSTLPAPFTFEPRIAQQVFNRWCADYADLTILDCKLHDAFTSVVKLGNRLHGIWTQKGLIKGKQFIDASYTGDLLRCAGVSWTANVEPQSTAEPDGGSRVSMAYAATNVDLESVGLTGADAEDAVKRAQFTIVSGPSDPLIPADGSAIPNTTIGYGTRSIVTKAADRIAFTAYKLASYDRKNHLVFLARIKNTNFDAMTNDQIVRDVIGDQGTIRTVSGEVAFNSNNAKIPQTTRLALDYPTANWQRRLEIEKDAIEHYINHCYFLSTDSAVPAKVRAAMAAWGHSGKEWLDSSYGVGIQFKVYDRQTIRMVNDNVVTAYDLRQAENSGHITDKIGIFSYFFDGKKRLAFAYRTDATDQKWTLIEESKVTDANTPMYAMSMRMLLPRASECTNLTVAWCCSMTELAFHSCRMEATGGILGEAAATIATLAIKQNLNVQAVSYVDVKQKLVTLGVNLGAL